MEPDQKSEKSYCDRTIAVPRPRFQYFRGLSLESFYRFKREVEVYFNAINKYCEPNENQVAALINLLGLEALEIVSDDCESVCESVDTIFNKLENHCASVKNVLMENQKFFARKQQEHELIDDYYEDLKKLMANCSFNDNDELLRTQLVLGLYNKKMQKICLNEDLPLPKIMALCKSVKSWMLCWKQQSCHKSLKSAPNGQSEIGLTEITSQAIGHTDIKHEVSINPLDLTMEDIIKEIIEIEKPEEFEIQADMNGKTLRNAVGSTEEVMSGTSNSDMITPNNSTRIKTRKRSNWCRARRRRETKKRKQVIKKLFVNLKLSHLC